MRHPVERTGAQLLHARECWDPDQRGVQEGRDDDKVIDHIGEGPDHRALEAVRQDCLLDLGQCECRLVCRRTLEDLTSASAAEQLLLLPLLLHHSAANSHDVADKKKHW